MQESNAATILLVDDEPDILEFMDYNLRKAGYTVYTATNGADAIALAREKEPALIILDIMMPEQDGIDTCRKLRNMSQFRDTVIAFLTARHEDDSQITGFDAGADDYITKPIKPKVFLSRVKGLLRRVSREDNNKVVQAGDLEIDRERYEVRKQGEALSLPRKAFELMSLLASRPGRVFTREEILHRVWGNEVIVGDRTIDVHIRKLREKVGGEYIKTVKGVGYKLEV